MSDSFQIDNPDSVAISYDEIKGVLKIVVTKRDDSTDEDLSYTFTANAGPVDYLVERHDAERHVRM